MNCTKCGKEIPEGKELCDECEKKEKNKAKKKETNKQPQKKKTENKNGTKSKKGNSTSKKILNDDKKAIYVLAIFACLLVVLMILMIAKIFSSGNKVGNTIGNIRNYGYASEYKGHIYFLSPNEDGSQVGIFRVKSNGEKKQELFMSEGMNIVSINVYKDYIYFIGITDRDSLEEDTKDNKIYRMKLNGKKLEIINDNEFNNNCFEIYVLDNSVYYMDENANICKMKLNGDKKQVVYENGTGYLGITEKYIIYNKPIEGASDTYETHIMDRKKCKNDRVIIEGKRLYGVNVYKNYIYYSNSDKKICRTKLGSNEEEIVLDTTAYNLNLRGKYIYFLNYKDIQNSDYTVCIYRLNVKKGDAEAEVIKELSAYSAFIDITNKWVIYLDSDNETSYINLTKIDGSEEKKLYALKYEDAKTEEDSEDTVESTTTQEETTEQTQEATTDTTTETTNQVQ